MRSSKRYWHYWGKAQCKDSFHLLPLHCLDVVAVALEWWLQSRAIRNAFLHGAPLPEEQIRAWVLFFIALHDLGKFDIRFQCKAMDAWRNLNEFSDETTYPSIQECRKYDHGSGGLYWFRKDQSNQQEDSSLLDMLLADETTDPHLEAMLPWMAAVAGHHGFVLPWEDHLDKHPSPTISASLLAQDRAARASWIEALEQLFLHPVELSLKHQPPSPSPLLAGFCSISDWLGSCSDGTHFRYRDRPVDLREYLESRREDARWMLRHAGLLGKPKPYRQVEALLKPGYQPRSVQTLVDRLPLAPGLTAIEAPTGSGKTEAALAYAWRLIAAGLADGVIFAMPTQATANAMLRRLQKLAGKLFEERPNLVLAHGHARFNRDFLALKQPSDTVQGREEAWAQCNLWLSQSRKRAFLGQIGICTVDQALISVLPVRHRFIRGFGLGRSVLIVDEVHAYDAYMLELLEKVLVTQCHSGGSAILLSATLPGHMRRRLAGTFGELPKEAHSPPYPLVTWTGSQGPRRLSLPKGHTSSERTVKTECLTLPDLSPDEALCQRVIQAAENGAKVAIVCNLVDTAQRLARTLQTQTHLPVDIFHARYCLHHRQEKENQVLDAYGPDAPAGGRILVATQVVEQSLDLDFDWLVTQLCPVDLLFQRMGRLHRHPRRRPSGFGQPFCTVLLPAEEKGYGIHERIYTHIRALWRTEQRLRRCGGSIRFPAAYRNWIESVYQKDPWGEEPAWVEEGHQKYLDELLRLRSDAKYLLRSAANPVADDDEKVSVLTRGGEMSLSVIPFCLTAEGKRLLGGECLEALPEEGRPEALAMNQVAVPAGWRYFLPEADDQGHIWLPMTPGREGWRTECGRNVVLRYHPEWGMERSHEPVD